MDISSDSSDTIILPLNKDFDEPSDTEVESILKKYSSTSSSVESKPSTSSQNKFYNLDLSDEELIDAPLVKRIRKDVEGIDSEKPSGEQNDINYMLKELQWKYSASTSDLIKDDQKSALIVLSDSSDTDTACENFKTDKYAFHSPVNTVVIEPKGLNNKEEINAVSRSFEEDSEEQPNKLSPKATGKSKKQNETEKKRKENAVEKERKKLEAEKKKAMKNLEKIKKKEAADQQKALKIALRNIERSTRPDECMKYMIVEIDSAILAKEYGTVLKEALKNNNISFRSTSQIIPKLISWCRKVQTIENMFVKDSEVNEKQFLLVMDIDEFAKLIHNNNLIIHIQEITELTNNKQLSMAIIGYDKGRLEQSFAMIEAQMLTKCYFRFVRKNEDLAMFVMELTKTVAQIPYKSKKQEKLKLQTEYFNDCNKDTVRVDKNGNGLSRLWHQMLTMFPLARLETAEAITAVYPTPTSLFKAYENCTTNKEKLIQDLPVRRAIGPLSSVRRVGPEMSKKCFNFFCSTENVLI